MTVDYKGFGAWLKGAREKADLTQKQLADALGKKKSYISKLENATPHTKTKTPPLIPLDTLANVVKELQVPFTEPLRAYGFIKDSGTLLDERESKALRYLRQLPTAQRDFFFDFLRFSAGRHRQTNEQTDEEPKTGTDN